MGDINLIPTKRIRTVGCRMVAFYEDLRVGRRFSSKQRSLSDSEIEAFARLTGDRNKLHTSEAFARRTIFGGRVAHGLLVLSAALGLWYDMGLTRDSLVALLGIGQVAFRAPVRPGQKFRLVTEVKSRRPSASRPGAGIVTLADRVTGNGGETLLEFERVLLVKRRPRK